MMPRSGRKRKLSTPEVKKLIKRAKSGKSAPAIAREISKSKERKTKKTRTTTETVSETTIRRRLKNQDSSISSSRSGTNSPLLKFKRDWPTQQLGNILTGGQSFLLMRNLFGLALGSTSSGKILKIESLAKRRDTLQNSMFGEGSVTILKQIVLFPREFEGEIIYQDQTSRTGTSGSWIF